jgi:hypothetical protein
MRIKYVLAGFIAAGALGSGCTEPTSETYLEGTVTSKAVVKDVFLNTETTYLDVDPTPEDHVLGCDAARAKVDATTKVSFLDDPLRSATADDLTVGQVVRVTPPFTGSDECPRDIPATSVTIVAP